MDHQACNQDFERGLEPGVNFFVPKLSQLNGGAEQTCATQSQVYHTRGSGTEMETNRVDWPVKPVERPVKFSFLAAKRYLNTNRIIHIDFIINKTFYKKQY